MTSVRTKQCWVFGCGGFLVIVAGITLGIWPIIFTALLKTQLALTPNSRIYDMWIETPIPLYLDLYLFNMTNSREFLKDRSIKPAFEQLGPYVFYEKDYKTNITFHDANDTVTFRQKKVWLFEPTMSNGTLDDEITNVNVIMATIAYSTRHTHYVIKKAIDFILREKGEQLLTTRTARELLFEGYDDPMIDLIEELNVTAIDIPYNRFGWFYPRNESETYDGVFNMHTGKDRLANVGVLHSWNERTEVPFYDSTCAMVNGTTGTLWPPVKDERPATMFVTDVCSSISLPLDGTYDKFGLKGYRYVGDERLFDNGTLWPEMGCFSVGEKVPSGVRNVSACKFGAPAFVSYPHFYLADPSYRESIDGMRPNRTAHELSLVLEPNSGIPMDVRAQLQINIMIQDYDGIEAFSGIRRTFVPMLLFRQTASLTEELANQAKIVVLIPRVGSYTLIGIVCIGALLLFIGVVLTLQKSWSGKGDGTTASLLATNT